MGSTRYLSWALAALVALFIGCDDGGGGGGGSAPDQGMAECLDGARRCAADGTIEACAQGR